MANLLVLYPPNFWRGIATFMDNLTVEVIKVEGRWLFKTHFQQFYVQCKMQVTFSTVKTSHLNIPHLGKWYSVDADLYQSNT